mmetsp:Transcript_12764/g.23345  ORF Transcript_12764/g.23345 Transcript_12764/m.23345 type:complete len:273 (+) Transcript_12764:371-1189(+)
MAETTETTSEPTPGTVVVVEQEMGGETTTRHDKQTDVVRTTPTCLVVEKEKVTVTEGKKKKMGGQKIEGMERDEKGQIIVACGIAGCQYKGRLTNVKNHKAAKHGIDVVWHRCDQEGCTYKAKQASNLKQHKQNVHDINVKWHYCDEVGCFYKAKQASHIKQHKQTASHCWVGAPRDHKGRVMKTCGIDGCEYKSGSSTSIKIHKAAKHGIDVTWHYCSEVGCNYKAKQASNLKSHYRRMHPLASDGRREADAPSLLLLLSSVRVPRKGGVK